MARCPRFSEARVSGPPPRLRAKGLLLLPLATLACATAFASIGVKPAFACGPYWTVGCQYYNYQEGHSITNSGVDSYEWVHTTFSPSNLAVRAIATTAGGSWVASQEILYDGSVKFVGEQATYKNGCYNDHNQTMWINCRAADSP